MFSILIILALLKMGNQILWGLVFYLLENNGETRLSAGQKRL